MALLTSLFLLYWVIAGLSALAWGCRCSYDPKNKAKLKIHLTELSEEFEITEQDALSIIAVGTVVFGFIVVPFALLRRWQKGRKKVEE